MIKVAAGIKLGTTVGPGPEARLIPFREEIVKHEVKNKKKPAEGVVPAVPGVTYMIPSAG